MREERHIRLRYWFGIIGPLVIVYSLAGVLVEAGVPHIFPDTPLTTYIGSRS